MEKKGSNTWGLDWLGLSSPKANASMVPSQVDNFKGSAVGIKFQQNQKKNGNLILVTILAAKFESGKIVGCLLDVCWEGPTTASGDMSFKEAPGPAGGKHDREIC